MFLRAAIFLIAATCCADEGFRAVSAGGLRNVFEVAPGFFSGSAPEGGEDFAALARLGVKTVVSVDGARPDVAAARAHGLEYVHIPFGYDGVPRAAQVQLARTLERRAGPVFLHCHHGRHRGPAGAACAMIVAGRATNEGMERLLETAGTSRDYAGLYRDVAAARPATRAEIEAAPDAPDVAAVSPLVDEMVKVDLAWARARARGSAADALLVVEGLAELARTDVDVREREVFHRLLRDSTAAARAWHEALRAGADVEARAAEVQRSCAACHRELRDR